MASHSYVYNRKMLAHFLCIFKYTLLNELKLRFTYNS